MRACVPVEYPVSTRGEFVLRRSPPRTHSALECSRKGGTRRGVGVPAGVRRRGVPIEHRVTTREYPLLEYSSRACTRQRTARGTHTVLTRYSHGTQWVGTRQAAAGVRDGEDVGDGAGVAHRVLAGYSRGTHRVRTGYAQGTHGVLTGYNGRTRWRRRRGWRSRCRPRRATRGTAPCAAVSSFGEYPQYGTLPCSQGARWVLPRVL